jgi:hypothetical protein
MDAPTPARFSRADAERPVNCYLSRSCDTRDHLDSLCVTISAGQDVGYDAEVSIPLPGAQAESKVGV